MSATSRLKLQSLEVGFEEGRLRERTQSERRDMGERNRTNREASCRLY